MRVKRRRRREERRMVQLSSITRMGNSPPLNSCLHICIFIVLWVLHVQHLWVHMRGNNVYTCTSITCVHMCVRLTIPHLTGQPDDLAVSPHDDESCPTTTQNTSVIKLSKPQMSMRANMMQQANNQACGNRTNKQTNKHAGNRTNKQTSKQAIKQTNKQTSMLAIGKEQTNKHAGNRKANKQACWQQNKHTNKQTSMLAIKQTNKQTNKQTSKLAIEQTNKQTNK